MYRLIPTEDEARDEDRTVSGSVQEQSGFTDDSSTTKRSRLQFIKDKFKFKPSFLSSSPSTSSCGTRTDTTGFTLPKKKEKYLIDGLFAKRLWKIFRILFTKHSKVTWLYISMTLFCILNEAVVYYVGIIPSKYYKVLGDKDSDAFWKLLFTSLLTVFMAGFGKSVIFLLGSLLSLESRRSLTLYFQKIYIQPKLFYRILYMHEEEVDNPYLHVRFRQFAESITFSRGEGEALESANEMLEVLLKTQLDVIHKELPLKFLQQSVSYFGSILSYVIIAIPIFWGVYDGLPPSDISAVISKVSFVSMYLTYLFSKVIQCSSDFSDLAGYTSRLGQLMEALNEINVEMENIAIDFPHEEALSRDTSIRFEDVSFTTPTGDLVITDFTFRFEVGLNTMIVGANGAGKTSLLRALGGLWPVSKGQIILPRKYRKDVIFIPQTSYLTYGTLREQLVYPLKDTASDVSDADMIRVMKLARLENIIELIEDFDFTYTHDWTKMLSPGEQQKMAFARLFYARPMFAVLDEATSSMDSDSEIEMFKQCRLLNITCITVCHNAALERFHQQKVILDARGGGWSFAQIQEQDQDDQHGHNDHPDNTSITSAASGRIDLSLPGDALYDRPFNS
ncbi:hypothetical protein BGX26_004674 [Mortierella sp. AD094]|nr:hypothetical protein BGX26_004674 [Mortierella sp. AD094]